MRLLFALPGFHQYDRGAEVALLAVADSLAHSGADVTVLGSGQPRTGSAYYFEHVDAVPRERFEKWPHFPPLRSETAWEDATFSLNLLRKYEPNAFDAVVTCAFPFTHWALRRPARIKPLQIFVTQNGDWPAFESRSEYGLFACDGLVCTNPDYFERNAANWNCALIPNGVDLARYRPGTGNRARFGLPLDKKIILMVSAIIESKRVLDGIRAVSSMENVFLVVAGDGPLRDDAQALANALMPGRFKRISLATTDMPDLYQSADAFLHLSLLESFGNVFLEAWASGLPIVGHNSERLRWILGSNIEFLCDTEDETALVDALRATLAKEKSSDASVQGIERFNWSTIAAQYREFIERLIVERCSIP